MTEKDRFEAADNAEEMLTPTEAPLPPKTDDRELEVVSVKFRNRGKMYFFDPAGLWLNEGAAVVVETSKGLELGDIVQKNHTVPARCVIPPLRPVVRIANDEDERTAEKCRRREREAFIVCKQKIKDHGLEMKLVDVECAFDGNKILFFFSSDGRVDFRELVKDLAGVFHTRIELRQIGVRDEARMLGGLGICGRPFCCGCFMDEFQPVSTKMAKTQSMSLNPTKISGTCGRLMCCLRYEQEAYEGLVKNVPKNGAFVETPDGYGNVVQVNILRQNVKVKLDGVDDTLRTYDAECVAAVPGGRPKDGSQPPHVLVLRPKTEKAVEEDSARWQMPEMLASSPVREMRRPETGKKPNTRHKTKKDGAFRDDSPVGERPAQKPFKPKAPRPAHETENGSAQEGTHRPGGYNHNRRPSKGSKPQNRPAQDSGKQTAEGGKPPYNGDGYKKKNPNYRPHYRPRPKSGGDGGKPAQGE